MLVAIVVVLRAIVLACGGHRAVALENLALRQQLAALTRTLNRPQLRRRDRLFWILLAKGWREWRSGHCQVDEDGVVFPVEAKVLALDQPAQVTASQTWNARLRSNRW